MVPSGMVIDTPAILHIMKKLSDTLDRKGTPTNKGDLVFFTRWRDDDPSEILGRIKSINGAYVYVANITNKDDIWELYSTEFEKATNEKATLWMFENR